MMNQIEIVKGYDYISDVQELILKYIHELNRNLDFQNIQDEFKHLKQKYAEPQGEILVALCDDKVVGCVAYYQLNENCCEMKRLFVLPEYRSLKIGEQLVENIIKRAKEVQYKEMVLDTIKPLKHAIALYKKYGFQETKAYYNNPMDDVIYMCLKL